MAVVTAPASQPEFERARLMLQRPGLVRVVLVSQDEAMVVTGATVFMLLPSSVERVEVRWVFPKWEQPRQVQEGLADTQYDNGDMQVLPSEHERSMCFGGWV